MKNRKGIILAGGAGTRLFPATSTISKQLLPIYDKPMIYHPLSTLMLAGITEILIISTPQDTPRFENLFGNGKDLGIDISYIIQPRPEGLAQAFILGKEFIGNSMVTLILGDNIFYGHDFESLLKDANRMTDGATVFAYHVKDPERYGVVEFNENKEALTIEEKPENPKSNFAVTGLYFYDNDVCEIAQSIKPSKRGELEITSVNEEYLKQKRLNVKIMRQGFAWLDTGTHDALLDASQFVAALEKRQGLKVACIEEIALKQGFINQEEFSLVVSKMPQNDYKTYLTGLMLK